MQSMFEQRKYEIYADRANIYAFQRKEQKRGKTFTRSLSVDDEMVEWMARNCHSKTQFVSHKIAASNMQSTDINYSVFTQSLCCICNIQTDLFDVLEKTAYTFGHHVVRHKI